jgi:hypothetical protein
VHRAHELERAGYPLNVFCTITPPRGMSDREAKRFITLKISRLGQSLERHGQPFVGMTAFEKPSGGNLHGHALQFIMRHNFDRIERWADRFDNGRADEYTCSVEIHARLVTDTNAAVAYMLKQHRWAGREIETRRKFYEKSEPIIGQRLSFTKAALAIAADGEAKVAAAVTRLQVIEEKTIDIVETAQISAAPDDCGLFGSDLPIMSAPPTQRQRCQRAKIKTRHAGQAMLPFDMAPTVIELASRLGPTHQAIAEKLGISRAQVSNIINGQFGPSRSVAQRVLELARAA